MSGFNYLNFTDMAHNAYQMGRQRQREQRVQSALDLAPSNPGAAENALIGVGAFSEASAIRDYRLSEDARKRRTGYSQKAGSGDYIGAQRDATLAGDLDQARAYGDLNANEQARAYQLAGGMVRIGQLIQKEYPEDASNPQVSAQRRKEAVASLLPHINRRLGAEISPDYIDRIDFSDKGLNAQFMAYKALETPKLTEVSAGSTLYDPTTQEAVYTAPQADKWLAVPEGGMLVNTAAQGRGQPIASQGTPASYQPQQGTRADRNNNPGNLRADGRSQWQGMTGVDDGGFVVFDTPENGQRAAGINLANQTRLHGINTLRGLIAKYAPASDDNDVDAYVNSVSQQTGIQPDQQVNFADPNVQSRVLPAMFKVEGGGTPARAPSPPPPQPTARNPNVIMGNPRPKTRDLTREEKIQRGIDPNVVAQVDERTGDLRVVSGTNPNAAKDVPSNIRMGYASNIAVLDNIDQAIASVQRSPTAFGLKNMTGDAINQRLDQNGVDARAAVTNISGQIMSDRSGAAVPAAEMERLKPYLPQLTDTPETVTKKLRGLKTFLQTENRAMQTVYAPEEGYKPFGQQARSPRASDVPQTKTAVAGQGTTKDGYTTAQLKKQADLSGGGEAPGTAGNPYMLRNAEELEYLKRNKAAYDGDVFFIAPDGSVRRVP